MVLSGSCLFCGQGGGLIAVSKMRRDDLRVAKVLVLERGGRRGL